MMKNYQKSGVTLLLLLLAMGYSLAQNYSVSGTVKDSRTGDGMAGVNVVVKGTSQGTITNINGAFTLNVPTSPATLQVSFIGYRTAEVQVSTSVTNVNVVLEEDVTSLEEVVISGLATTVKRTNLANAVVSVDGKELMGTTNPQTLDYALYGKMTGVNMNSNSGAPGGGVNEGNNHPWRGGITAVVYY